MNISLKVRKFSAKCGKKYLTCTLFGKKKKLMNTLLIYVIKLLKPPDVYVKFLKNKI